MSVDRATIESVFASAPFPEGLFYARPGGLRFELSQGADAIVRFLSALSRALVICDDIFDQDETVGVGLTQWAHGPAFGLRATLRSLRHAGIRIPRARSVWVETEDPDDDEPRHRRFVAFEIPRRLLRNVLWCALACDLGIEPNPWCRAYLFSVERRVLVHPYDDRGMDVVGDASVLAALYLRHGAWLLDYDRARMAETFGSPPEAAPGA